MRNMQLLDVFPPTACVKIGDTPVDIEEGINAGMWTVGVIDSGNLIGLTLAEWSALPEGEKARLREAAREAFRAAGADFVVGGLSEAPAVLDEIERRLEAA